jgi:hypothetical protein
MIKIVAVLAVVAAAAAVVEKRLELPIARLTLRALDEQGVPISGARVEMSFEEAIPQWGGGRLVAVTGQTDNEGRFSGEGHSVDIQGGQISKEGYYSSSPESFKFKTVVNGKWQPWNPTLAVLLKKIVRPVPMYAKFKLETELPTDGPIGFDLVESDWVAPYGHGKSGDLILKLTKRVASFHDFGAELLLGFPNKSDGIQETIDTSNGASRLRSPQEAPDTGYGPTLSLLQGNSKERGEYGMKPQQKSYAFRVRTVLDERGQIVTALYGKIYDTIEYFPVESKTAKLRFTYYLNPTPNDRSLEFDSKRNLFTNLKDLEKPTAP